MFAVIRTGGKQYRVAANDVIEIEHVAGEAGEIVEFGEVLMLGGDKPELGAPLVSGAMVAAEVLAQKRGPKVIVFKKKRRKNYRRKNGHRQLLTAVRITEILTEGRKPSQGKAEPAKEAPAKEVAAKKAAKRPKNEGEGEQAPVQEPPTEKKPAKKAPARKSPAKKPAKGKAEQAE
jgi:large subunit ribosomal protein L21